MKARKFETVVLRFKFQNFSAIPQFIRQRVRVATKKQTPPPAGERVIDETRGSSVVELLLDLEQRGYSLIDAACEEFLTTGTKYYIVQYTFAQQGSKEGPSERFLKLRPYLKHELFAICSDALWGVTAYVNPCIKKDGTPTAVKRWASIVFCGRQPFFYGGSEAGRRVTVWAKDPVTGEHIGTAPVPLAPSYHLRTAGKNGFVLLKAV